MLVLCSQIPEQSIWIQVSSQPRPQISFSIPKVHFISLHLYSFEIIKCGTMHFYGYILCSINNYLHFSHFLFSHSCPITSTISKHKCQLPHKLVQFSRPDVLSPSSASPLPSILKLLS